MHSLLSRMLGVACGAVLAAGAFGQSAPAGSYPTHPVKLIAPFPAGSNTDQVARVTGNELQKALGQPFIVENKPGAQGSIAAEAVARSAPDGYTLLLTTNSPLAANVSLFKRLAYDPVKDFAPVARLGVTAFVIMVKPDFQAKTLPELIALAKSHPGKLSGGSGGGGGQISIALLKSMANIDVMEVSYKGVPQAITDVLGSNISFALVDLGNAAAQAKGGKLIPLGVTLDKRTPLAPGVPAIAETLPGFDVVPWLGLVGPAGTPPEIVAKLYDATARALSRADVKASLANTGTDVALMNPSDFGRFIQSEIGKWATLVKLAGMKPE